MRKNSDWFIHLIPLVWFTGGVLYARSLEAWAGIGIIILVIISTFGLLAGTIVWHITKKIGYALATAVLSTIIFFGLIVFLVRTGG
ncbi:MAG: hypothetical protein ACMXYE_04430 [Candidatus Woesearchaeota archaeon]